MKNYIKRTGFVSLVFLFGISQSFAMIERFENLIQEEYTISDAWWTDMVDMNGDGYTSSRKLNFDVDVDDDNSYDVYAEIYYKTLGDWCLDTTTSDFTITGSSSADAQWVVIEELPHDEYDFEIDVYKAEDPDNIQATRGPYDDGDLIYEKFETSDQDIPNGVEETMRQSRPHSFYLSQNYPNPFSTTTAIKLSGYQATKSDNLIARSLDSSVALKIYDLSGKLIQSFSLLTPRSSLLASIVWDGRDNNGEKVPAGIYFYRLQTADFTETRKLTILR